MNYLNPYLDSGLLYLQVDVNLNHYYHIVLGSDENNRYLKEFGVICGYDVKHDFNAACVKTNIF